jgi:hypothetical protein
MAINFRFITPPWAAMTAAAFVMVVFPNKFANESSS